MTEEEDKKEQRLFEANWIKKDDRFFPPKGVSLCGFDNGLDLDGAIDAQDMIEKLQ